MSIYLLKILSGPHIGAEMLLKPGSYQIGRSVDCDIVLQDELIAQQHIKLELVADQIRMMTTGQAAVLLNGAAIAVNAPDELAEAVAVPLYTPITLGTTHLAIGKPGGEWAQVVCPNATAVSQQALAVVADQNPTAVTMSPLMQNLQESAQKLGQRFGIKAPNFSNLMKNLSTAVPTSLNILGKKPAVASANIKPTEKAMAAEFKNSMQRVANNKLVRKTQVLAYIFLGISVGLTPAVFSFTNKEKSDTESAVVANDMETLLGRPEFADIQIVPVRADHIIVKGYVADEKAEKSLASSLEHLGFSAQFKVWTGSQITNSAQTILSVLNIPDIKVTYLSQGKIRVEGYVANPKTWSDARATLLRDVAGLKEIDDTNLENFSAREAKLQALLREADLSEKLAMHINDKNELTVYGVLGSEELERWRKVLSAFQNEYGNSPVINSKVYDTRQVIELDIKSVRVGEVPYLTASDNSRYLEGSVLPNGYAIKSILSDRIILSKNNIESVYHLSN